MEPIDVDTNPPTLKQGLITAFKETNQYEENTNSAWRLDEQKAVAALIGDAQQTPETERQVQELAIQLALNLRERKSSRGKEGLVQGLLQEFSLSSNEGIALMCLAEALLRIPDKQTRDLLIQDKINQGNWQEHVGHSPKMFVNAATWGLIITDKLIATPGDDSLLNSVTHLIGKFGKPVIRKSVDVAMRIMGEQFVTGETIQAALKNSQRLQAQGFAYSYDMLGEAALTAQDAERYYQDYLNAIHVIGKSAVGAGIYRRSGISIKLSALHPRYQRAQIERVHAELYPKLLSLVELAKQYNIGINIDAEESERLALSLALLERLCYAPSLAQWNGIGFVIQSYQKRCYYLIDYLLDLARRSQHRLMIRLVKGAYWDSEIKKAQVDGMPGFPVFTRKVYTDLSYLACAKKLLAAEKEIFPQFATHNAQTLAAIYHMAKPETYTSEQYEFQCLHGMGEPLYEQVVGSKEAGKLGIPCRIYAPVGNHETLLAYLVRRLLENGANSSFVNRIADTSIAIEDIVRSPFDEVEEMTKVEGSVGQAHPLIRTPHDLYGDARQNSQGYDLQDDAALKNLQVTLAQYKNKQWQAYPSVLGLHYTLQDSNSLVSQLIKNPANHLDIVGVVQEASLADVETALQRAHAAQTSWAQTPTAQRAKLLCQAADLLASQMDVFMVLLARESGKTYANAVAEVREAVDFLRYYSAQARCFDSGLSGDLGENSLNGLVNSVESHSTDALNTAIVLNSVNPPTPLGTVLCISPWNFPLAIFLGQISAALVVGNVVIAKPAEQTPLVAFAAIKLLWQVGVPEDVIQVLPGRGETVGATLSQDARIDGIMFTGSTDVAKTLQKTLAQRVSALGLPIPLVAETGGQNAMIVDSSALIEQVVQDVIVSAFDSAGQRCSALRVLCVQEDCYDTLVHMLKGAAQELYVGNTLKIACDIGPVIDQESKNNLLAHIEMMRGKQYPVSQYCFNTYDNVQEDLSSTFVLPTIIELDNLDDLMREVFGPVLHIIKFKYGELDSLLDAINAKGFGLTMGLHTRIDSTIAHVITKAQVGNVYINRNIVGAVVGVQPFGGQGLSGTGPKAGGPLYLHRLVNNSPLRSQQHLYGVIGEVDPRQEPSNDSVESGHGRSDSRAESDLDESRSSTESAYDGSSASVESGHGRSSSRAESDFDESRSSTESAYDGSSANVESGHGRSSSRAESDYDESRSSTESAYDGSSASVRSEPEDSPARKVAPSSERNAIRNAANAENAMQAECHILGNDLLEFLKNQEITVNLDTIQTISCIHKGYTLPGPTGESNTYYLLPRHDVLAIASDLEDHKRQVYTLLAMGSHVGLLRGSPFFVHSYTQLPTNLQTAIRIYENFDEVQCEAILHQGSEESLLAIQQESASKLANIVPIVHLKPGEQEIPIFKLVHERAVSVNTTAAGGNTSLMMLDL